MFKKWFLLSALAAAAVFGPAAPASGQPQAVAPAGPTSAGAELPAERDTVHLHTIWPFTARYVQKYNASIWVLHALL
ncbi:MAG: hypothetical protein LBV21_03465, partial [Candidatus Adiutrix sp.]|nr:hypothetical protein [Candidatus Adiutrix sp.]